MFTRYDELSNDVENAGHFHSQGFHTLKNHSFAAMVTNPPIRAGNKVIYPMMENAYNHLLSYGELWVVIQKKQGAPSLIKFLSSFFQEVKEVKRNKGYFIIRARKDEK